MAALKVWLEQNWFTLLQSVGIICGLLFTSITIRHDTRARRATDLLSLAERHQALWGELNKRPDLQRILKQEVDLLAAPVSQAEEEFLRVVFVHFYTGWLLSRSGALLPFNALVADVRAFFNLPIPQFVWKETRAGRDPNFLRFVDKCLKTKGKR